jgi:hypothetical protein
MPLYATHLLVGLICSLPFYHLDKKDRLRTIIAGMFAAVLPDIDGVLQYIPHPEAVHNLFVHRGLWHWWGLLLIFAVLGTVYITQLSFKNDEVATDTALTFTTIIIAWASHLILDFGFTKYQHDIAMIFEISWDTWFALGQFSALILSLILAYLLHSRSFHKDTLV